MFIAITKTKIIVIVGILVLSVTAGLFIQIYLKKSRSKFEQAVAPNKAIEEVSTLKKSEFEFPPVIKELEELNIPTLPIPRPNLEISKKNPCQAQLNRFLKISIKPLKL